VAALTQHLVARADVITPNLPEAAKLIGRDIEGLEAMNDAAQALLSLGPKAVLLKGGHAAGAEVTDILATAAGTRRFVSPRIDSRHTHGTGCTLASAIATGLAQGMTLDATVERARAFVHEAIRTAPGLGHGHGPLNHAFRLEGLPQRS
jgi:hydroxymethylpyrimidine/phosphomethylpyrimidine kinase